MEYKGYHGAAQVDEEAGILHGEVLGISDVITFQGRTVDEVVQAFKESVDDYLEWCEKDGKAPNKPFSGKLNLRLGSNLHQEMTMKAKQRDLSLNAYIVETLEKSK